MSRKPRFGPLPNLNHVDVTTELAEREAKERIKLELPEPPHPFLNLPVMAQQQLRGICPDCGATVQAFVNPNGVVLADLHHLGEDEKLTVCAGYCQPVRDSIFSEVPHGCCRECETCRPLQLPEQPHWPPIVQPHEFCGSPCSGSGLPPAY
jgi:hypothetical protein